MTDDFRTTDPGQTIRQNKPIAYRCAFTLGEIDTPPMIVRFFQLAQWIQVPHTRRGDHWNWFIKPFTAQPTTKFPESVVLESSVKLAALERFTVGKSL